MNGEGAGPALAALARVLLAALGPQGWWPAETRDEMVIGAVLTQGVAWRNAAAAIANLKRAGLCRLDALASAEPETLAPLLRPAGYFNVKARKLTALAAFIAAHGGLDGLRQLPDGPLRASLLGVYGVGPETADAILCYALGRPAFVADGYARRVLGRAALLPAAATAGYELARRQLLPALPADAGWLGEFHALLVAVGKDWCRPKAPRCPTCPAREHCATGQGGLVAADPARGQQRTGTS